jgi:8-oxo-dGTP diphosphatase
MRAVSVAHLAVLGQAADPPPSPDPPPGPGPARFWAVAELERCRLAFDHAVIATDALARLRSLLEHSPLATAFCEEPFTLGDLRRVYEAVWGRPLDAANFARKITGMSDFVVPVGASAAPGSAGGRPARLYRRGNAPRLHPALLQAPAG